VEAARPLVALRERVPNSGPGWQECGAGWLLRQLSDDDADTLRGWLADPVVSVTWIVQQVDEECGLRADAQALRRHRRGECKC